MALAGVVVALAALFGIGYAHGPAASRTGWTAFAVFAVGMQLVPAAADAVTFLLTWELMAGGSTVLLLADHASREPVRRATIWYAVMTHLSFLLPAGGLRRPHRSRGWHVLGDDDGRERRGTGSDPRLRPPRRRASRPRPASFRCTSGCRRPTRRRPATCPRR